MANLMRSTSGVDCGKALGIVLGSVDVGDPRQSLAAVADVLRQEAAALGEQELNELTTSGAESSHLYLWSRPRIGLALELQRARGSRRCAVARSSHGASNFVASFRALPLVFGIKNHVIALPQRTLDPLPARNPYRTRLPMCRRATLSTSHLSKINARLSTKVTEHHHSFSRSCTSHPSLISLSYSRNPSLQREEYPCVIAWPLPSFLLSRPRLCLSTLSGRRRRLAL